jgi:GMP synthase (glutamine-hydrolysing)
MEGGFGRHGRPQRFWKTTARTMRFSILKAGTATPAGRERVGDVDQMFIDLLAFPESQWDVHDVEHGMFPETVAAYDGFVITGGKASAYDRDDWVLRLLDTVREAHARQVPLLGICLGHQVIAKALGGEVGINPKGWEIGLTEVRPTPDGHRHPALAAAPNPLWILETHQDVVTRLPPGAVHLAASGKTEFEMYHLGPSVLCLQGHPEMDNEEVREIIRRREKHLAPEVVRQGMASLAGTPHRDFLQNLCRSFLRNGHVQPAAERAGAG